MVVVCGMRGDTSIVSVSIGQETEASFDLQGSAVVDLTEVLSKMDRTKPVLLRLVRCGSEQQLVEHILECRADGEGFPYLPSHAVFAELSGQSGDTGGKPVAPHGKCTRCGKSAVELVPRFRPGTCYPCMYLDSMLAHSRREAQPDTPTAEEQT